MIPESEASAYRLAAYDALRDLDTYAEAAGDDAQAGPLAVRARLRADLDLIDRSANPTVEVAEHPEAHGQRPRAERTCSHGPDCALPWSVHDWSYEAEHRAIRRDDDYAHDPNCPLCATRAEQLAEGTWDVGFRACPQCGARWA